MHDYAIGIDLGGTGVKAALVERGEGALAQTSRPTEADKGPEHVIETMVDLVEAMWAEAPDEDRVVGIGIGAPGNIDLARTTLMHPPNLPGWDKVNLRDVLQAKLDRDIPVIIENDANVAGLGSAFYGAGRPYDSFIMVTLGTGVGGAIILDNKIFRGTTGSAGEIGHMTIDYEGPVARSGVAGAIEAYLGQHHLTRHARFRLLAVESTVLHAMAGPDLEDLSPKLIYDAAMQDDEAAIEMLAWAGHKLGCFFGSIVQLLDVRKFVVGGGVSAAGDFILEPARKVVRRYVMPGMREDIEIVQETLGNQVGILGAAHLAFDCLDERG